MGELSNNQKKAFKFSDDATKSLEAQMMRIYRKGLNTIRAELLKTYEKIELKGVNASFKIARLENMQKQIVAEMRKIRQQIFAVNVKTGEAVANETYNRHWFGLEKELKVGIDFGRINPEAVKAIVLEPYPNTKFSSFFDRVTQDTIQRVRIEIGQALLVGEGVQKLSARIKKILNTSYYNAMRIARTETLRVSSRVQLLATEKTNAMGIETGKIWDSTLDSRTRSRHRHMDGREADKDGVFHTASGLSMGQAPRLTGRAEDDILCRCSYIERIEEASKQITRLRNEKEAKAIDGMSYSDWKLNKKKKAKKTA